MKRSTLILAAVCTALLGAGCSHLRVQTEVYTNRTGLAADGLPGRVAEIATIAHHSLDGYESRLETAAVEDYWKLINTLKSEHPVIFQASAEDYVKSFTIVIREALAPVRTSADAARRLAVQLGASGGSGKTFKDADNLIAGIAQLKLLIDATASQAQSALDGIAAREIAHYREAIEANYLFTQTRTVRAKNGRTTTVTVFPNDANLAQASGMRVTNATRAAAVEKLVQNIKNLTVRDDAILREELVAIAKNVAATVPDVAIVPLHDENIPTIITDQANWKRAVNDVRSTNIFGNAEIAFRMDGLGDSHIKGILFDPSEAIKAGLDVFSKALQVTAAAYAGRPIGTTTTTGTGNDQAGTTTATTTGAATAVSKPAIDAEIAEGEAALVARTERLQSLFWNVIAIGRAAPADDAAASPGVAKELIALAKCAGTDLVDGENRKCGGQS